MSKNKLRKEEANEKEESNEREEKIDKEQERLNKERKEFLKMSGGEIDFNKLAQACKTDDCVKKVEAEYIKSIEMKNADISDKLKREISKRKMKSTYGGIRSTLGFIFVVGLISVGLYFVYTLITFISSIPSPEDLFTQLFDGFEPIP